MEGKTAALALPPPPAKRADKNFKWTRAMTRVMVAGLVEQATLGMKVDKGFKRRAYAAVARQVTERFGEECLDNNVENRFKTLKRNWAEIKKLRAAAGPHVFDAATHTILLSDAAAAEYIKANPKAEPFVNQPIEMYEELGIICGDEKPTGFYSRGSGEPPAEDGGRRRRRRRRRGELNGEEAGGLVMVEEEMEEGQSPEGSAAAAEEEEEEAALPPPGRGKKGGWRRRERLEEKLEKLAEKIGYMAEQMARDRKKEHADELHGAVVGCEGYTEAWLMEAYGYLLDHNTQANVFLRSSPAMRRDWLEQYFSRR